MKHNFLKELKEEFTGRRNVFTVTIAFIGGYFIAYPLVNLVMEAHGPHKTMALGFVLLVIGDYMIDAFHKH